MAHHPLPNAEAMKAMNVNELMHATLRLSDIMAEESELLDAHRYHDIAKLHDEKLRLTGLLESYQHAMATNPNFLKSVDGGTREELLLRADDLAYNVEGTFRKVSVARAVNQRILQGRDAVCRACRTAIPACRQPPLPGAFVVKRNLGADAFDAMGI